MVPLPREPTMRHRSSDRESDNEYGNYRHDPPAVTFEEANNRSSYHYANGKHNKNLKPTKLQVVKQRTLLIAVAGLVAFCIFVAPDMMDSSLSSRSLLSVGFRGSFLPALVHNDGPPADLVVHGKRAHYTPVPPQYRKQAWVGLSSDSHLKRAFRSQGWTTSEEDEDFSAGKHHILYKRKTNKESYSVPKPWQRFSRVPGSNAFCQKDSFYAGLRDLQRKHDKKHRDGRDLIYFLPETYKLDEEKDQKAFTAAINKDKAFGRHRPWVLKKVKLNNGKGIEMIAPDSPALYSAVSRSKEDAENDYIIQSYICNEMTWFGGEKFDLRFYWMVASVDPMIVLYHDGYARVAGALYDETDFGSTNQHLTNHAFRGEVDEDVLANALWRRVQQHYEQNEERLSKLVPGGDPIRHVRNQIKEAISATVEAFKDVFTLNSPDAPKVTSENLFAFYGADFIIDADLDVYYVEAQSAPGLGDGYDYRIEMFRSLLRPMINVVEEIAMKQEKDPKANLLPLEKLEDWEIVNAGDWRYKYEGYERSKNKKGCMLSK